MIPSLIHVKVVLGFAGWREELRGRIAASVLEGKENGPETR